MNARQKAKICKKQLKAYENLFCKPNEIHIDRTQLMHHKISFLVYEEDQMQDPDAAMDEACNEICRKLMPIIRNNITISKPFNPLHNAQGCVFDVWTLK